MGKEGRGSMGSEGQLWEGSRGNKEKESSRSAIGTVGEGNYGK